MESQTCWAPSLFLSARVKFPEMFSRYAKTSSKRNLYQCKKKVTLIFKVDFSGRCGCMRRLVCPLKEETSILFSKKTKNKDQISLIHRIQLSFFWNAYALFQFGSQQVKPKHPQSQKLHILDRAIWQFDLNPIPSLHHWLIDMNLRHCPICVPGGYRFGYNCCDAICAGG